MNERIGQIKATLAKPTAGTYPIDQTQTYRSFAVTLVSVDVAEDGKMRLNARWRYNGAGSTELSVDDDGYRTYVRDAIGNRYAPLAWGIASGPLRFGAKVTVATGRETDIWIQFPSLKDASVQFEFVDDVSFPELSIAH